MSSRFLPILGGTMIVAGTAIGAGMLALPMISAGMWFYWSVGLLLVSWFCMFRSSQAILEVNLHFEPGDSFHTLVRELLGPFWSTLNGLAVAFVLYTLVYAYVSGGGSVVQQSLAPILGSTPPRLLSSLLFALLLTVCVWWSSKMVDRLSVLLMGGMALSFLLSISGMIGHIRLDTLLDVKGSGGRAIFIWGAVSTYLTSFCFHASVPSLVKYLGKEPRTINACLRYGTLIALVCYLSWIVAADGNIPREHFKAVIAAGGNVGDLVAAAGNNLNSVVLRLLEAFSLLAVATSFLGAGLGLFDYMADLCNFDDSRLGRTKTLLITFAPPMLCGLIWPDGFLPAIGWAGLAASIWSVNRARPAPESRETAVRRARLCRAGRRAACASAAVVRHSCGRLSYAFCLQTLTHVSVKEKVMKKEVVSTDKAPAAVGPYSQAIRAGDMLFLSGQVPLDPATGKLVEGGIEEQAARACKNLAAVLESQGLSLDNVVKTTVFLTDISKFPLVNEVYKQHFKAPCPARSCVEVSALPLGVQVEIEAIAVA